MSIQCTNCGAQNREGALFCDRCGSRLTQPPAEGRPDTLPEERPPAAEGDAAAPAGPPAPQGPEPAPRDASPAGGGWRPPASPGWRPATEAPPTPRAPAVSAAPPRRPSVSLWRVVLTLLLAAVVLAASYVVLAAVYALLTDVAFEPEDLAIVGLLFVVDALAIWGLVSLWRAGMRGAIVGEARGVQERQEGGSSAPQPSIIWSFRVERYDQAGNRLPPVPVEMRGIGFDGFIREGDRVEVRGRWREGRTIRTNRVRNLTTGAVLKAKRNWLNILLTGGLILAIPACLAFLAYASAQCGY